MADTLRMVLPDGSIANVPQARLQEALDDGLKPLTAGTKPGTVAMKLPDGSAIDVLEKNISGAMGDGLTLDTPTKKMVDAKGKTIEVPLAEASLPKYQGLRTPDLKTDRQAYIDQASYDATTKFYKSPVGGALRGAKDVLDYGAETVAGLFSENEKRRMEAENAAGRADFSERTGADAYSNSRLAGQVVTGAAPLVLGYRFLPAGAKQKIGSIVSTGAKRAVGGAVSGAGFGAGADALTGGHLSRMIGDWMSKQTN